MLEARNHPSTPPHTEPTPSFRGHSRYRLPLPETRSHCRSGPQHGCQCDLGSGLLTAGKAHLPCLFPRHPNPNFGYCLLAVNMLQRGGFAAERQNSTVSNRPAPAPLHVGQRTSGLWAARGPA